jgi:hypothetical protein
VAPNAVADAVARVPMLVVCDESDRVVGQYCHRALESLDVLNGSIDQKVDVFRGSDEAVENDRKAADQNVANTRLVQRFAEGEEVFELRCA